MLGTSDVILRVTCEVQPMRHFHIARMLRRELRVHLGESGFDIPYPRMVMYNRKDEIS